VGPLGQRRLQRVAVKTDKHAEDPLHLDRPTGHLARWSLPHRVAAALATTRPLNSLFYNQWQRKRRFPCTGVQVVATGPGSTHGTPHFGAGSGGYRGAMSVVLMLKAGGRYPGRTRRRAQPPDPPRTSLPTLVPTSLSTPSSTSQSGTHSLVPELSPYPGASQSNVQSKRGDGL
jgi:hypothetical protein